MKFKNSSGKVKFFKKDGEWLNINPGDEVELSGEANKRDADLELIDFDKPEPEVLPEKVPEVLPEKPELKSEKELKKMSKDGLNDYAAIIGLNEVKSSWRKSNMIKEILQYQNGL